MVTSSAFDDHVIHMITFFRVYSLEPEFPIKKQPWPYSLEENGQMVLLLKQDPDLVEVQMLHEKE